MSRSWIQRCILAGCILGFVGPLLAQQEERPVGLRFEQVIIPDEDENASHRPIKVSNIDPAILQQRWQDVEARLKARSDLQALVKKVIDNPKLLENDPKQREELKKLVENSGIKLDPNDPLVREMQKWLQKHRTQPGGARMTPETQEELRKLLDSLKKIEPRTGSTPTPSDSGPQPSDSPNPPAPSTGSTPPRPVLSPEEQQARLRFTRWLVEQSQRLDRSKFQDSDLLREMRHDLEHVAFKDSPRIDGSWRGNPELNRRLQHLSRDIQSARIWSKINLPTPRVTLPGHTLPGLPSVGSWGRPPTLGIPRLGTPSLPSKAPSGNLLWAIAGVTIIGFIAWRLIAYRGGSRRRDEDAQRRNWTVVPDTVTTSADVVRAFEHLSLAQLGVTVRSWNHRRIAAGLGNGDDARRTAASALSSLYERARYAPNAELSPGEIQFARRSLALLCGGGA
jgi:hypothetical protein